MKRGPSSICMRGNTKKATEQLGMVGACPRLIAWQEALAAGTLSGYGEGVDGKRWIGAPDRT